MFDSIFDLFDGIGEGLGRLFSGLGESGGIFENIGGGHSSAFMEDVLSAGARSGRAAEGFSAAWRFLSAASDVAIDWVIWEDVLDRREGNSSGKPNWNTFSETEKSAIERLKKTAKAHGFIASQLERLASDNEYVRRYKNLGPELPDSDLLKNIEKRLNIALHPDKNPGLNDDLFKELKQSVGILKDQENTQTYNKFLKEKPAAIKNLYTKVKDTDWEKAFEGAQKKVKKLTGPVTPPTGFSKWVHERTPAQRAGLIVGGVTALGLGAYMAAHIYEQRKKAATKENAAPNIFAQDNHAHQPKSHADNILTQRQNAAATNQELAYKGR